MKILNCYNCGSGKSFFYAEENGFSLVKCKECGLLYIDEPPDEKTISKAHMQGKHEGLNELDVTGMFNADKIPIYLKVLQDLFKGNININGIKTWLDVGCGHGEFMMAVKEYARGKILLRGTEPNIHKQESARKRGLDVNFFDLESHEKKYDAISLLNVYSHLPDPPAFIDLLKQRLNSWGVLLIQTGDTANFQAKEHCRPFYLPDHLSFASERIVITILQRLGFEIMSIKKYPFLQFTPMQVAKEIVKVVLPKYNSRIKYYIKYRKYSQTDMYILARVKR